MTFNIRFRIGKNRLGAGSRYSLKEFCISVVERYSLTETEVCTIATLQIGKTFKNEYMEIQRIK